MATVLNRIYIYTDTSAKKEMIEQSIWNRLFDPASQGMYLVDKLTQEQNEYIMNQYGLTNINYVELIED